MKCGWPAGPSDLPAGAVEHLGRAGDGDRALGHAVEAGQRQVLLALRAVKHQVLVHLIGDHQKVGCHRDLCDGRQLRRAQHRAGRVVRRVDDQRAGPGGHRPPQGVGVEGEAAPIEDQRHRDPMRAGHRHHRRVGIVEGFDQDYFRAGLDQPDHRRGDGFGGADRHQHLGVGVVLDAEMPPAVGGDGLAQRRDAYPGRVLVGARGDRVLRGLQQRRGSVLVGKTLPEVHRAEPRGQRRHLGEHRRRVRPQPRHRHGRRA